MRTNGIFEMISAIIHNFDFWKADLDLFHELITKKIEIVWEGNVVIAVGFWWNCWQGFQVKWGYMARNNAIKKVKLWEVLAAPTPSSCCVASDDLSSRPQLREPLSTSSSALSSSGFSGTLLEHSTRRDSSDADASRCLPRHEDQPSIPPRDDDVPISSSPASPRGWWIRPAEYEVPAPTGSSWMSSCDAGREVMGIWGIVKGDRRLRCGAGLPRSTSGWRDLIADVRPSWIYYTVVRHSPDWRFIQMTKFSFGIYRRQWAHILARKAEIIAFLHLC